MTIRNESNCNNYKPIHGINIVKNTKRVKFIDQVNKCNNFKISEDSSIRLRKNIHDCGVCSKFHQKD